MKPKVDYSPPGERPKRYHKALFAFACICLLAFAPSLFASGMAPTTSGPGGNMDYHIASPGASCSHAPVTVFGNVYKIT